jgi:dihydrofolate reductase
MKTRRKIIVFIATSADGYIARPDGDIEWLNRRPRTVDYGMREFYPTIDTILWGRKTYDWVVNYYKKKGKTKGLFDRRLTNYVFSRTPPNGPISAKSATTTPPGQIRICAWTGSLAAHSIPFMTFCLDTPNTGM